MLGPHLGEHRGDDEALGVGVQGVHVDDRQLVGEVDLGEAGAHETAQPGRRLPQAAHERLARWRR